MLEDICITCNKTEYYNQCTFCQNTKCATCICNICSKTLINEPLTKMSRGVGYPITEIDFGNIIGGLVTDIGFIRKPGVEGGLVIDFIKDNTPHRIIYGFNDLGFWKEFEQ